MTPDQRLPVMVSSGFPRAGKTTRIDQSEHRIAYEWAQAGGISEINAAGPEYQKEACSQ